MKKNQAWSFVLLCVFWASGFAQSDTHFGFKGGLNLGNAEVKPYVAGMTRELDSESRSSLYAGAFIEYSLEGISPNLYGQLGLQYVSSGYKLEGSSPGNTRLDQLNLPFVFKYRLLGPLLITAGVYWGLILQVRKEDGTEEMSSITDDFKAFDAGLLIGGEIPLTKRLFLEGRYNYGLVDVVQPEESGGSDSYLNRFIQLGVGVKF